MIAMQMIYKSKISMKMSFNIDFNFINQTWKDNTVMPTTFHITEAVTEPMNDILSFKEVCIENVKNDDFFAEEAELFELCKYIKALFPEDFDRDIGKFEWRNSLL